ncbi:MAG: glycosyl hydrolase family 28 protein [Pirellulaceae bacterium]
MIILVHTAAIADDLTILATGAVGDGQTLCTAGIQKAIDQVSTAGGGRVTVPHGIFKSGSLFLKRGVELHLAEGAVLLGSTELSDYPKRETRIEGHFEPWTSALINGQDLDQVTITGRGTLDGNGKPFWIAFWKRRAENPKCTNLEVERPRLVFLQNCENVTIDGIHLKDSGFWNLHVYKCRDGLIENITIRAPHGDPPKIIGQSQPWNEISVDRAPSSDGIDSKAHLDCDV